MEVEEFLKEAAVMKEIKHPNLVQLLGKQAWTLKRGCGQLPVKGSGPDVRALSKHHVLIRELCVGGVGESEDKSVRSFHLPWVLGAGLCGKRFYSLSRPPAQKPFLQCWTFLGLLPLGAGPHAEAPMSCCQGCVPGSPRSTSSRSS